MKRYLAIALALLMCASLFAACAKPTENPSTTPNNTASPSASQNPGETKSYTFNTSTTSFGNMDWNPHTWESSADSKILSYVSSGLYDFRLNDSKNAELFPLVAAAEPIDVTANLTAEQKTKYGLPADASSGYAWKYPIRENVTFQDGYKVTAQTFIDSYKLLLDPKRMNRRSAEQRTGETPIAGADGYYNQGKITKVPADADADVSKGVFVSFSETTTFWGKSLDDAYVSYGAEYFTSGDVDLYKKWKEIVEAGTVDADGYYELKDDELTAFETDFAELLTNPDIGGGYEGEWLEWVFVSGNDYTDAKYSDFGNVGLILDDEYTFTIVYGKKVTSFNAKYYQTSSDLVHLEKYEELTKTDNGLTTSTYGTSKETTFSFGPYVMSSLQEGKEILFERNESWFGYQLEELNGAYQATKVRLKLIEEQATELLSFLKGELDNTELIAGDLVDYGTSDYLLVEPETYLNRFYYHLVLDDLKSLDASTDSNSNTVAILNQSFRLGLSFAIDRNEVTKITNRTPAFAMLNDLYTYDYEGELADGAKYRYRDLDAAKEAILNIYNVKYGEGTPYATLDIALDSITGYDPAQAAQLFKTAFEELSAGAPANGFDPAKPVNIRVGLSPSAISPTALAEQDELNAKFAAAVKDSGFAGLTFEFITDENRYQAVTDGRVAMSVGAIGGARQDPWGITSSFLNPNYSVYYGKIPNDMLSIKYDWDEDATTPDTEQSMTLSDWCNALTNTYFEASLELKAFLLGTLESYYLKQGYTTPIESYVVTSMHSIRVSYPLEEFDPVMGFGGLAYAAFSMDDAEWADYISKNAVNGELAYK